MPEVDEAVKAKRSATARKGAETKQANREAAEAAARPTRRARAPKAATVAELEQAYSLPSAPVSGA